LSTANEINRLDAAAAIIKQDKEAGLPYSPDLQNIRNDFINFCKNDRDESNANKSMKMARVRSIRATARKILKGEALTSNQRIMLESLTQEEMDNEIVALKMTSAQKTKWERALNPIETPKRSRPRRKLHADP
jgi:hypothetical protein